MWRKLSFVRRIGNLSYVVAFLLLGVCPSVFGEASAISRIIDEEVSKVLEEKTITPAPRATDAELVRRIYLDVLGRIPTADETTRYLDGDSKNGQGLGIRQNRITIHISKSTVSTQRVTEWLKLHAAFNRQIA